MREGSKLFPERSIITTVYIPTLVVRPGLCAESMLELALLMQCSDDP